MLHMAHSSPKLIPIHLRVPCVHVIKLGYVEWLFVDSLRMTSKDNNGQ